MRMGPLIVVPQCRLMILRNWGRCQDQDRIHSGFQKGERSVTLDRQIHVQNIYTS